MAMKHFERLCNVDLYAVPPIPHFIFFQVEEEYVGSVLFLGQ